MCLVMQSHNHLHWRKRKENTIQSPGTWITTYQIPSSAPWATSLTPFYLYWSSESCHTPKSWVSSDSSWVLLTSPTQTQRILIQNRTRRNQTSRRHKPEIDSYIWCYLIRSCLSISIPINPLRSITHWLWFAVIHFCAAMRRMDLMTDDANVAIGEITLSLAPSSGQEILLLLLLITIACQTNNCNYWLLLVWSWMCFQYPCTKKPNRLERRWEGKEDILLCNSV